MAISLITNSPGDRYEVRIFARKNQVRFWTCESKSGAFESAWRYLLDSKYRRAEVRDRITFERTSIETKSTT